MHTLADTINNLGTGSKTFYCGAANDSNIANDYYYNKTTREIYLTKKTNVKGTVKFALNDGNVLNKFVGTRNDAALDSSNLQYKIILLDDMTIDGTLEIGASVGINQSQQLEAHISGEYVELDLNGHNIIVNGTMNIYGVITDSVGTGKVEVKGGNLKCLATIYDYRGGSTTKPFITSKIFPFYQYCLPYLRCSVEFTYSNKWGTLSASAFTFIGSAYDVEGKAEIQLPIVGPSSESYLFGLETPTSNDAKFVIEGYKDSHITSEALAWRTAFKCYNLTMGMNNIEVNIDVDNVFLNGLLGGAINTKDLSFPLSPFFDIRLFNTSFTLKQRLMMMTGSTFVADDKSELIFDKTDNSIQGEISIIDTPVHPYINGGVKQIEYITSVTGGRYSIWTNTSFLKYYGNSQVKCYGKIYFTKGNTGAYKLAGKIDFDESKIGYIDENSKTLVQGSNPFEVIKNQGINIKTYGFEVLHLSPAVGDALNASVTNHSKGYARPLINGSKAYAVDSNNSLIGVYDEETGIFTSNDKTYFFYTDENFSAADSVKSN